MSVLKGVSISLSLAKRLPLRMSKHYSARNSKINSLKHSLRKLRLRKTNVLAVMQRGKRRDGNQLER